MSGVDVSGGATTDPAGPDDRTDGPDRSRFAWRTDAWCLVLIAVVLLLPVPGLMRYQGPPMEEGFMLVFPEQLLNGPLPHRDFLHLYGPGSLWVLAAVFKVFGTDLFVERMVGLAQHAAVAFGMFALLRPWGRRIATSGAHRLGRHPHRPAGAVRHGLERRPGPGRVLPGGRRGGGAPGRRR